MAITVSDLRFYQSERMTDTDDGGGRMTANEILPGAENSIFDDISDVDRAAGDVSIRKVYAAVTSDAPDKYLDAGVVILAPPEDPTVAVTVFSTGDFYDERAVLKSKLESGISRGARYVGYLWGPHGVGQRAVTLWQRPEIDLPALGMRLELVAVSNNVETHSQVLWVTRTVDELVTMYDGDGAFVVRSVVCELAEPLRNAYVGREPARTDGGAMPTVIYRTRYNHDAVQINGIATLTDDAGIGDYTLRLSSLYSPLIPTAFAETALPDVTPGGDDLSLVGTRPTTITFSTNLNTVGPGRSLFVGSPILPGSLAITVSGSTLTDDNGVVRLAGLDVGTVDYGAGVARFNASCPAYGTAAKSVVFRPAARPVRVADTATQQVTVENRGYVWVLTLAPIPQPGTLRVAYRVNNEWYVIQDLGGGRLAGADSSYGTGQLNFATGTVTLSLAAIPDAESEILYTWSTAVDYLDRSSLNPQGVLVRGQTTNPNVLPGTVEITWTGGTLTDAAGDGALTGTGGEGQILYSTGAWWVKPAMIPAKGTEFTVDYEHGDPADEIVDTWAGPALGADGKLALTLSEAAKPGSVRLSVAVDLIDYVAQTGELAEDVPPPVEELPSTVDTPRPTTPMPEMDGIWQVFVSLYTTDGLGQSVQAAGISSTKWTSKAAAEAAAGGLPSTATLTVPGRGQTFSLGGLSFVSSSAVSASLTSWKIHGRLSGHQVYGMN